MTSGHTLYRSIIKPLRDADQAGTKLLERYLVGPQATHDRVEGEILSLLDQVKPTLVRSDLLSHLKAIVGFTAELRGITDRLDETALRRLITLAVPLWNQRHTVSGLVNAIRLLTGRTAFVTTWFGYRWLLGETMLIEDQLAAGGDSWVIGDSSSVYDEYWSNIRIMDDGTLDELLLIDICRLMRPMSERMEVFLNDFLDKFNDELDKWTLIDGGAGLPVIVDGILHIPAASSAQPVIPILATDADHVDYNIVSKFKLDTPTSSLAVRFYKEAANTYYQLRLIGSGLVVLDAVVAGVTTNLYSAIPASVSIVQDVWYKVRITVDNVDGTNDKLLRVLIDGNMITEQTHTSGVGVLNNGPFLFIALINDSFLDNVESWRNPGRFATIGLDTPSQPGGAAVLSPNFVQ